MNAEITVELAKSHALQVINVQYELPAARPCPSTALGIVPVDHRNGQGDEAHMQPETKKSQRNGA
jgi:hypothetical protein